MKYLDTNILYYLAGISNYDSSKKEKILDLLKEESFYITKESVFEIIANFHKDAKKINEIFAYCKSNNIQIYEQSNIYDYEISIDNLIDIDEDRLETLWKEIICLKIDAEVKHVVNISIRIIEKFVCLYYKNDDIVKIIDIFNTLKASNLEYLKEKYTNDYNQAYLKEQKPEKFIKESFNKNVSILLCTMTSMFDDKDMIDIDKYEIQEIDEDIVESHIESIMKKICKENNVSQYLKKN